MHRVGYILSSGFQTLALGTQAVFEFANLVAKTPWYDVAYFSATGGQVSSSMGLPVLTQPLPGRGGADTWMVVGNIDPLATSPDPDTLRFLRKAGPRAHRVVGLCTGGFILAEAGLLENRRATTHWHYADVLQQRHPSIQIEADRIFIVDGTYWTSAGMTAGMDLALAMVEKDLGIEVARSVAHHLVMDQRRLGGQSQYSEMLKLAPRSDRIQQALEYARRNLARPLSVETLAEAAHLSPRQFSRIFSAETGQTPAKAVENLRLEAARLMIEQTRHPMEIIARESGFRDRRHMREAFLRGFGIAPQMVRRKDRVSTKDRI